ncbi:MAG: hypothetical protein MZV49_00450 [Rhodopseudomonas palustris]|nr:hypothetical protein [Rhodopseudomonas palustris]
MLLAGSAALAEPNEATPATRAAQQQVTATLPLGRPRRFRGRAARPDRAAAGWRDRRQ